MKWTEHSLTEEQLQLTAQNPIFRSVALSRLAELLEREVLLCSFRKDEIIYSPDHFEERIGLFLSGTAVAEKSKGTIILNTFEAGSCFGVATLFSQSKRYVTTIRAKSNCLVAFLSGESMIRLFREEPQISLNYIAFLASRIHFLNRKIDQFTAVSAALAFGTGRTEQSFPHACQLCKTGRDAGFGQKLSLPRIGCTGSRGAAEKRRQTAGNHRYLSAGTLVRAITPNYFCEKRNYL